MIEKGDIQANKKYQATQQTDIYKNQLFNVRVNQKLPIPMLHFLPIIEL